MKSEKMTITEESAAKDGTPNFSISGTIGKYAWYRFHGDKEKRLLSITEAETLISEIESDLMEVSL